MQNSWQAAPIYNGAGTNMMNRMKETDRIGRENNAFAKRIFAKGSVVSKKALDKDYQQHLKYLSLHRKTPVCNLKKKKMRQTKSRLIFQENGINFKHVANPYGGV